jgi:hypothetical protein
MLLPRGLPSLPITYTVVRNPPAFGQRRLALCTRVSTVTGIGSPGRNRTIGAVNVHW